MGEHHRRRRCELPEKWRSVRRWNHAGGILRRRPVPAGATAPTATGSTTWRVTCMSGAGIGRYRAITDPHPRPTPAVGLQPPAGSRAAGRLVDQRLGPPALCEPRQHQSGGRDRLHRISECEGALTFFLYPWGFGGLPPGEIFLRMTANDKLLNMATSSHVLPRQKSWATTLWSITSK